MDHQALHYTESHEWVLFDGEIATVGITDYAAEQLTDVTNLELPKVGTKVEAGHVFGEIESVKAVFDLNSPVTGEVVEVNQAVVDDPSEVTEEPLGKGWMIKVRVAEGAGIDHLKTYDEYKKQLASEGH